MCPLSWFQRVIAVVLVMVAVFPLVASGSEWCAGDSPAVILSCLQRVYADLDSTAYAALLAGDYVGILVFRDGKTTTWNRAEDLSMNGKVFRSGIVGNNVTYSQGYRVAAGEEPHTWVISDLTSTATFGVRKDGQTTPITATSHLELGVRSVSAPATHYELIWAKQLE